MAALAALAARAGSINSYDYYQPNSNIMKLNNNNKLLLLYESLLCTS
jgi:hypothetical protein